MIRVIRSRRFGRYTRNHVFYNGKWVKWVGFAALPLARPPRRWVGLAIERPTKSPKSRSYSKHDNEGNKYRIGYDPETGEPLQ